MAQKSFMQAKERGNKYFVGGYSYEKLKKKAEEKSFDHILDKSGQPGGAKFFGWVRK